MNHIINIAIFSVMIINVTQARDDIATLKQIFQSIDTFQDCDVMKFIDSNQDLNDIARFA